MKVKLFPTKNNLSFEGDLEETINKWIDRENPNIQFVSQSHTPNQRYNVLMAVWYNDHDKNENEDNEVMFKTLKEYGAYLKKGYRYDQKTYARIEAYEKTSE